MMGKCDKMNRIAGVMVLAAATLGAMAIAMTAQTYSTNENPAEDRLPQAVALQRESAEKAGYRQEAAFTVTAYCPCEKCCGAYANGYTATGAKATQGVTIAADPDVLPMGTEIELDGHTYTVQDTGGAIAGNRLDLYFDSHEDALQWGVREKTVRWAG